MHSVTRTLVKSIPELWTELSDPAALNRHLAPFGPLRITAAEPSRTVGWEAEKAAGEVRLAPAGFGTRVTLEATVARPPAPPATRWQRLLRRRPPQPPPVLGDDVTRRVLEDTLDALGRAHHRPYSRA
jgi:hypothetical protein